MRGPTCEFYPLPLIGCLGLNRAMLLCLTPRPRPFPTVGDLFRIDFSVLGHLILYLAPKQGISLLDALHTLQYLTTRSMAHFSSSLCRGFESGLGHKYSWIKQLWCLQLFLHAKDRIKCRESRIYAPLPKKISAVNVQSWGLFSRMDSACDKMYGIPP